MGGKSPSIPSVTAVQPPQIQEEKAPDGQETSTAMKQRDAMKARAAAAQTILTGPGGLDDATAVTGKVKLGQ